MHDVLCGGRGRGEGEFHHYQLKYCPLGNYVATVTGLMATSHLKLNVSPFRLLVKQSSANRLIHGPEET